MWRPSTRREQGRGTWSGRRVHPASGARPPSATVSRNGIFARWLRREPRNYFSHADGGSRALQPVRAPGRSPSCDAPDVRDGPESRPHGALLRKRGQGRVHVVPRVPVSVARTPLPLRERACCPLLDTRLPPGHTPPCGLRGARPSSAAGAGPVSPSSPALMARGTCLPGADPPFWLVPVTPGKRTGKGEGCWLLESNRPCSPVPAEWPWEVTTLSEPDLVHGGAGAQLGSERSSQFLVKLPGRQARRNHVCKALAAGSQLSPRPRPSRTSGAETKSSTRLITGASPGTRPPASGAVRRSPR